MKKYWIIGVSSITIFILLLAIWVYFFPIIHFTLIGEEEVSCNYQDMYKDAGVELKIFGFDAQDRIQMTSNVDTTILGEYVVRYEMKFGNVSQTLERKVTVKDLEAPVISATFDKVIYIEQQEKFRYPVFSAKDNYDGDVTQSLSMEKLDTNYIGVHFVQVHAEDSSGNVATYIQPVAIYSNFEGVKKSSLPSELLDGVYQMKVVDEQLQIRGYIQNVEELSALRLVSQNQTIEIETEALSTVHKGYFQSHVVVDEMENDTYEVYYGDQKLQELGTISTPYRLGRYHIGNKLVTFSYEDGIQIKIEDFAYVYDIAIDVGHGGGDPGAVGLSVYERDLNLEVSLYEKQRYEEHGLKVWLIREDTDYPELLGDDDWVTLQKMSYTLGWYGAVSKYTYSNHHNSDTLGVTSGPEIIVVGDVAKEDLTVEYRLYEDFKKIYPKITTDWPLFTRSYNTAQRISRVDGTIVNERVWYANMRYTYECFGVITTTYEGVYINNAWDNKWYVKQEHWKLASEAKIRAYVEALGIPYIEPNNK